MWHFIKKSVSPSMVKVTSHTLHTRCRRCTFLKWHSSTCLSRTMCSCAFGLIYLELSFTSNGKCLKNMEAYCVKKAKQQILTVSVSMLLQWSALLPTQASSVSSATGTLFTSFGFALASSGFHSLFGMRQQYLNHVSKEQSVRTCSTQLLSISTCSSSVCSSCCP